jgi:NAD(P)-dependent dehydrogenase (short-subunit alcohol dehydrogenase family)
MPDLLSGHVAVVTGGASGIGREIALEYAREGADVVVADLQPEPREGGTPTHETIEAETEAAAKFVECDVSNVDEIRAAVDAADEFGGVSVMVNNAGIFRGEDFLDVSPDEFDHLMDVNVKGTFFGAQAAARKMVENDVEGSIVNLSSVAGLEGSGGFASYCTSKGATRLMTYSLADALGEEGINVNAIHPGVIETEMTTDDVPIVGTEQGEGYLQTIPSRRFGDPKDIADAAVFLASDMSDYVNAESMVVDGGMTNSG